MAGPEAMKNLKAPTLYLQAYNEIRDYIVKNNLKAGDKLPTEAEMCNILGVSRNVLREAIKALEITGVVRSTPGVGSVIQEFNSDYLFSSIIFNLGTDCNDLSNQLSRIRYILESGFAHEAFNAVTEDTLISLSDAVSTMERIIEQQRKLGKESVAWGIEFAKADASFHRTLYSGLELPLLLSLLDAFWAYNKNYVRETSLSYMQFTVEKHRQILNALRHHDYRAFLFAIEVHYNVVYQQDKSGNATAFPFSSFSDKENGLNP